MRRVRRKERIGWKNNVNDRNMRLGEGLSTAGTFNYRHTNTTHACRHLYIKCSPHT